MSIIHEIGRLLPARELFHLHASAWAARARSSSSPEALLLDPFAGRDHPLPCAESACSVSVAAGAPVLRVHLCEDDPVKREWLASALPEECTAAELRDGGDQPLAGVAEAVESAREVLAILDPPYASRLPLAHLRPLLSHPSAELLIRFPVAELRRLVRYPASPLADLPPAARRVVEGVSALLADARHAWAPAWREELERAGEVAAEKAIVARYAERLKEAGGRVVRIVELESESGMPERLLLVAPDATRALALNERVHEMRSAGLFRWPAGGAGLVRYEDGGEIQLFGGEAAERVRVVDRVQLADAIARRFAGRTVPLTAVAAGFLESDLFVADLRRALADLRRDGRALYRSLAAPEAKIAFPRGRVRMSEGRGGTKRGADLRFALEPGG